MQLHTQHTLTGTIGRTDNSTIIRDFKTPNIPNGISSYTAFLSKHITNEGILRIRISNLVENLKGIEKFLKSQNCKTVDPVGYIAFLYYSEKLSIQAINKRLNEIPNVNFTYHSLHGLMHKSLEWKLRERIERTSRQHKELTKRMKSGNQAKAMQEKQQIVYEQKIKDLVEDLLAKSSPPKNFNLAVYQQLKNTTAKISYILQTVGLVDEDVEELVVKIESLNEGNSVYFATKVVSSLCMRILGEQIGTENYQIELVPEIITNRRRRKKKKEAQ